MQEELAEAIIARPAKRARSTAPRTFDRLTELNISWTVARETADLKVDELLPVINEWMAGEHCLAGLVAAEKGGTCGHLHLQGVLKVMGSTIAMLRVELGELIGWKKGTSNLAGCGE